MDWLEVCISVKQGETEKLSDLLAVLGISGLVVEDETEFLDFLKNNHQYWDYVDEELLESKKGQSRIKFYLEEDQRDQAQSIREQLEEIGFEFEDFTVSKLEDQNWESNWRQYYKPVEVGENLLIVPEWEEAPESGRVKLYLEPGLIFGTGTHPTTKMCLKYIQGQTAKNVLDLGCGSGILAIAAMLFGAESAVGCDIDEKAPDIAIKNAKLNGIEEDSFKIFTGDILTDRRLQKKIGERKYKLITANIVADVIIALSEIVGQWLDEDGTFICSGIIEGREEEVKAEVLKNGFIIEQTFFEEGWNCFVCKKSI